MGGGNHPPQKADTPPRGGGYDHPPQKVNTPQYPPQPGPPYPPPP